jgi:multimeric flavodoxin WrbA
MKVLALVGSPRKGGNTDILTDEFLCGASEAGAEVEKVYLDDLCIRPIGEVADKPSARSDSRADDDLPALLERFLAADVVAIASPVYWQGVSAQMKCFVDRWSAYVGQESFKRGFAGKGFAVLCPCGAPDEQKQYEWVTGQVKGWIGWLGGRYLGDVCVSAGARAAVARMPEVLGKARELGRKCAAEMRGGKG